MLARLAHWLPQVAALSRPGLAASFAHPPPPPKSGWRSDLPQQPPRPHPGGSSGGWRLYLPPALCENRQDRSGGQMAGRNRHAGRHVQAGNQEDWIVRPSRTGRGKKGVRSVHAGRGGPVSGIIFYTAVDCLGRLSARRPWSRCGLQLFTA